MIDSKSYKKYQNVKGEFRDRLMKGIDHEGTPAFHLMMIVTAVCF